MGLAGNGRLEVQFGFTDGQARRWIADRLQVLEVPMAVPGLAFRRGTEHRRHVVVAFNIRLGCEIQVAAIRLGSPANASFRLVSVLLPLRFTVVSCEGNAIKLD